MTKSSVTSVTQWIDQLKCGDRDAAFKLWQRYYQQLVSLALSKLRGRKLGISDKEDAVIEAFDAFVRGAEMGKFPMLSDRNNL